MAGYLDNYGVVDAQREKKVRILVASLLTVVIGGSILYFGFRDYAPEHKLKQFMEAVQSKDYKSAYTLWGCTMEAQCRDYSFDKFMEDWGPSGANAKFAS